MKRMLLAVAICLALVMPVMAQSSHVVVWENSYNEVNPGDTVTAWIRWNAIRQWEINYLYVVFWYDDGDGPGDASVIDPGSVETVWEDEDHTSAFYAHAQATGQTITQYGGFYGWGALTSYYVDVNQELRYPYNGEYAVGFKWDIPLTATPGSEVRIGLEYADGRWPYPPQNAYDHDRIENNDDPLDPDCLVIRVDIPGDFDGDRDIDADDIDDLCDQMGLPYDVKFDVDDGTGSGGADGDVDEDDLIYLIESLVEWDNGVDTGVGTAQGDFNLDGVVNATDLAIMKGTFGTSGVNYADGNANCDELVNATDLAILKGTFGFVAPPGGSVPEPMTIGLLALGGMGLLRGRRRYGA